MISIHALREEGDQGQKGNKMDDEIFLSTPSARRATGCYKVESAKKHISIHALREEGDCTRPEHRAHQDISIHALREEGDGS